MNKYKVSILIPIYNVEKFIEKCIVSLMEQTFESIQYIFVDDCGNDNSMSLLYSIIKKYPNRYNDILVITHKENRGLSAARNTGVQNAEGEYIYHLDSDDYIEKETIEILYNNAILNHSDLVFADYFDVYKDKRIKKHFNVNLDKRVLLKNLVFQRQTPHIWNVLIKKDLYIKYNISLVEGIDNGEDYFTIIRLVYNSCNISFANITSYNYIHYNLNSFQCNRNNDKNRLDILNVNMLLQEYFLEKDHLMVQYLKEYRYLLSVLYLINKSYINSNNENISIDIIRWKFPNLKFKQKLICWLYNMNLCNLLVLIRKVRSI